jgi:hypothetical protein
MYLGQVGYGVVMLFTFGLCGIGQLLDLVLLPDAVREANRGLSPADQPSFDDVDEPGHRAASPRVSSPAMQSDDGELDQLLRAAQESVKRTQQ